MTRMYRILLFNFLLLTAFVQAFGQQESASTGERTSVNGNEVHRWTTRTGATDFNIEIRGKIEVTDDDKDIKSLSNDGYLKITKTVFGSKRTIQIESLGGGQVKREYFEGRTQMDWETNGKQWLGEILPEIVRSTTVGAESRVNRIFSKGGSDAVLKELARLEGDHTRAHYAKLLLEKNIPASEMADVVTAIAEHIDSDYYLSTVFQNHVVKLLSTTESANAFYLATQKIGSDYYKSVVLKEALKKFHASPAQVKTILQSASTIDSDYYLSVVLTALLDEDNVKDESLSELIVVTKNIPSDYYRSQVLTKALEKDGISKPALKNMIDALGGVNSDYYKTGVVTQMADRSNMDGDIQVQVIKLVGSTVSSDFYAAGALKSMLDHQKLTDESFKQLVIVGGQLKSGNSASDVLRRAAKGDLSKAQLLTILQASSNINSDYYLSEVLLSLSDQVRTADNAVKDAYRQAARKINSESYYGKALKAID